MNQRFTITMTQYQLLAGLCVLLGELDQEWIPALVDTQEWTQPRYGHQN